MLRAANRRRHENIVCLSLRQIHEAGLDVKFGVDGAFVVIKIGITTLGVFSTFVAVVKIGIIFIYIAARAELRGKVFASLVYREQVRFDILPNCIK